MKTIRKHHNETQSILYPLNKILLNSESIFNKEIFRIINMDKPKSYSVIEKKREELLKKGLEGWNDYLTYKYTSSGNIWLMFASIEEWDMEMVEYLLKKWIDINTQIEGMCFATYLYRALASNHFDIFKYLIDHWAIIDGGDRILHNSIIKQADNNNFTLYLIEKYQEFSLDINKKVEGMTPLFYAITDKRSEILKKLLETGRTDFLEKSDEYIHQAKYCSATELVKILEGYKKKNIEK